MPLLTTRGGGSARGFGSNQGGRSPYQLTYLVAAGGAGGAGQSGGGGGAGGLLTTTLEVDPDATYSVTIGSGSPNGGRSATGQGGASSFGPISTTGGGGGGNESQGRPGRPGGSGGGCSDAPPFGTPGSGTPGQGNPGGQAAGGGKNSAGSSGNGGSGLNTSISGSPVTYSSGGPGKFPHGGSGGSPGGTNTGSGGGGGHGDGNGQGAPGVVILSYPGSQLGTGGQVSSSGGNTIHRFTGPGTYTA